MFLEGSVVASHLHYLRNCNFHRVARKLKFDTLAFCIMVLQKRQVVEVVDKTREGEGKNYGS